MFQKRVIPFLSIISAMSLYATNGDQMIATGTKSMGMGGVGIAIPFGAESGIVNPALISYVESKEVSGSATLFFPSIDTKTSVTDWHESDSKFYLMPSVQYAQHLEGSAYGGIGVWGVAGMGVDFSDTPKNDLLHMKDDLMIMHIATPFALREQGLSIGLAPIIQVGMLDIEMKNRHPIDKDWTSSVGAVIGMAYDFQNGLIVGAKYRTPISMSYDISGGGEFRLEQPGEFGVGFSYSYEAHTIAFDYKNIQWGSAEGYKNANWKDQSVYAVGYRYSMDNLSLSLGYNYGKTPIDTHKASAITNYMNLLGFPATSEHHYTAGISYKIDNSLSIDLATIYSPENKTEGKIFDKVIKKIENKHSEFSLTAQINYKF